MVRRRRGSRVGRKCEERLGSVPDRTAPGASSAGVAGSYDRLELVTFTATHLTGESIILAGRGTLRGQLEAGEAGTGATRQLRSPQGPEGGPRSPSPDAVPGPLPAICGGPVQHWPPPGLVPSTHPPPASPTARLTLYVSCAEPTEGAPTARSGTPSLLKSSTAKAEPKRPAG